MRTASAKGDAAPMVAAARSAARAASSIDQVSSRLRPYCTSNRPTPVTASTSSGPCDVVSAETGDQSYP